jgi:hypothetical protein
MEKVMSRAGPASVADIADGPGAWKVPPIIRRNPEIWVAIVLWLASNVFVTGMARFATWEGGTSYHSAVDLCHWDCGWYASVLENGYDHAARSDGTANWPFHPGFPLTAYPFHSWLKLPLLTSMVYASKAALLFAIYGFILLVGQPLDSTADHFRAGSLVAFNPYLIYAHAGYAEPLYFALAAFAFVLAGRRKWIASGIAGALLSLTRVVGFLFALSYAIMSLRESGWRKYSLTKLIGLLLCPLGTALFMLYLHHHTGDALAQVHVHLAWVGTSLVNPLHALWTALALHHWPRIWGAIALAGLAASAWLFKLQKPELGTYLALSILVALSGGSPNGGLYGMARYVWWQPPFLYTINYALKRYPAAWPIYTAFSSGMASFMIWEWFSGHNLVV